MRSAAYVLRLMGQILRYAVATRRLALLLILALAPLAVAVAWIAGVASPFAVYPFV